MFDQCCCDARVSVNVVVMHVRACIVRMSQRMFRGRGQGSGIRETENSGNDACA